jgi:amino acid transporter
MSLHSDEEQLRQLGYEPELSRRLHGFANLAISMSIICILAGGVTSFSQGFSTIGGAAIGLGWPLWTILALIVAATMGQIASAFPTAGGLYHWSCILGGRGWGWVTAWFNLAGLIAVLTAINRGTVDFILGYTGIELSPNEVAIAVVGLTCFHGLINHFGIGITSRLTTLSGWWILAFAVLITGGFIVSISEFDFSRLVRFSNFSGLPVEAPVIPPDDSLMRLFLICLLLPAYTLTGFDASAHIAEETHDASAQVPRGIFRSVLLSGIFGWIMLVGCLLAMPDEREAAERGANAFAWTMQQRFHPLFAHFCFAGIVFAQILCGLATVTSTSRMVYAFSRDGGLPCSQYWSKIDRQFRAPCRGIWLTVVVSSLLTLFIPYSAIAASCAVLLYISYVLPVLLGAVAINRSWTHFGPWHLRRWFRPSALIASFACLGLILIGMQPPNEISRSIFASFIGFLLLYWVLWERKNFRGPPKQLLAQLKRKATDEGA